jgi:hypothetical protein
MTDGRAYIIRAATTELFGTPLVPTSLAIDYRWFTIKEEQCKMTTRFLLVNIDIYGEHLQIIKSYVKNREYTDIMRACSIIDFLSQFISAYEYHFMQIHVEAVYSTPFFLSLKCLADTMRSFGYD